MSISAVTTSAVTTQESTRIVFEPRNFLFLVPTISAIAFGLIFFPHFGLGLAAGAADLVFTTAYTIVLDKTGILPQKEDKNSKYEKMSRNNLLVGSVFAPIAEEGLFRGLLQPLCARAIQILLPATAAALFGPHLTVAVVASIVATSIVFGAVHYMNPHKNAHIQAITAGIGSLPLGFLSAQFGIGASIAAHLSFNTLVSCVQALKPANEKIDTSKLPA